MFSKAIQPDAGQVEEAQGIERLIRFVRRLNIHVCAQQRPRLYFALLVGLALLGCGFLLFFPLMSLVALWREFEAARQPLSQPMVLSCVTDFGVFLFGIAMSHHIYSIRFPSPKGLLLQPDKSPRLYALLQNKQGETFWPRISQVVITERFELDIKKVPVSGFPFWTRNILVIGLPFMQCLSQPYFEILLQRKLIQHAKGRNVVTNWLSHLSHIWQLYPSAFRERKLLGDQLISGFFRFYAPRYQSWSVYCAQADELMADSMTLAGVVNDGDLLKSIETQHLGQHFVEHYYLPLLLDRLTKHGVAAERIAPYTNFPKALTKMFTQKRMTQLLQAMCRQKVNRHSAEPPLYTRMENIGHNRVRQPALPAPPSAAQVLLQKSYAPVCQIMDKAWVARVKQQFGRQGKRQSVGSAGSGAPVNVGLKLGTA